MKLQFGYPNNRELTIKFIRFQRGKILIFLNGGQVISAPLHRFPEIQKLNSVQRKKYHIIAGIGFDFDDSQQVYHLADFLGNDFFNAIETRLASEPKQNYMVAKHKRQ